MKLRLRDALSPKIATVLKERIKEILSDPEEQLFFDLPKNNHLRADQLDDSEEESFCQMLDQTEKRTGYKFGDGYRFIRKRVKERKNKRL